jgi:hypothetical protein
LCKPVFLLGFPLIYLAFFAFFCCTDLINHVNMPPYSAVLAYRVTSSNNEPFALKVAAALDKRPNPPLLPALNNGVVLGFYPRPTLEMKG